MPRGLFLSLDGLDGSGKTTQGRLLTAWLRARGHTVTECADPGGTAVGAVVRELLLGHRGDMALPCEALLFMASRAQLVAEVVRPALAVGNVVVCDRFLLANIVYQGHAGGLDPAFLWQIGRFATGGLEPDLTLVFDLLPDAARSRRAGPGDRVECRDAAYHARVRDGFIAEARRDPDRIRILDASRPVDLVHQDVCKEVARVLATGQGA